MKAYAYLVDQRGNMSLEEITRRIFELPLDRRGIGGDVSLRLEERSIDGDFVMLDFANRRGGHGPGLYARTRPLSAFSLREDEDFGEDTALVYHAPSRTAAVQYNHHGPKIQAIENQLTAAHMGFGIGPSVEGVLDGDRSGVRFGAVLTQNAINRLRNVGFYRSIDFAIAVPGIREGDAAAGRAVADALRQPLPAGVETIEMTIGASTKKNSKLDANAATEFITSILAIGPAVKRAIVKAKRGVNDPVETIDLVEERVGRDILVAMGDGGRYPTRDRWAALREAWEAWREAGQLPI
jgi:hypothetical protein